MTKRIIVGAILVAAVVAFLWALSNVGGEL